MSTKKIVLTPRQEAWLCRHFRNTRNAELAARLGISETSLHRLGKRREKKRVEKAVATRNATIRDERMRIRWGLEQRTRMKLNPQPRAALCQRYYLRRLGYHIDRGSMICRYDQNTRRSLAMESRKQGDPHFIAWKFLPFEQ